MQSAIKHYLDRTGHDSFTPKLALFDMDGVLYNSMPHHAKAWNKAMEEYGLTMTEEDAFAMEGMRGVETIQQIATKQWGKLLSEEECMEIYNRKTEVYNQFPVAELIPGIKELQQELINRGIKIGVVTGSGQPALINRIFNDFDGLVSRDIVVTALDVKRGKPAPDPYLQGMEKGHCLPSETMVIENAPLGVKAAVAAGCLTIAVNTGPLNDSILYEAGADIVFPNMASLSSALQ